MKKYTKCVLTFLYVIIFADITQAQTPTIQQIYNPAWAKQFQAPGSEYAQFPRGISYDIESGGKIVKKALVNWQTNSDSIMFPMTHGWMGTVNGCGFGSCGIFWNSPAPTNTPELDMMGAIRRNTDGVMVAIPFYPNPITGSTFTFSYKTSTDNGTTWVTNTDGLVDVGANSCTSFRFHRGIIQKPDGTLYAGAYGIIAGSAGPRLMKSVDGGKTWTYRSRINTSGGNEVTIVRCKDNSLLSVARETPDTLPLKYTRSTDDGLTWSAMAVLPGLPTNRGVDPYLYMMPNGILVLSYGTIVTYGRNCVLAYSVDGNGTNWTNVTTTFTGAVGLGSRSTGYTTIFPTRSNRFMQISDRGVWKTYGSNPHPTPNPFSIWTTPVDVVLNHRNRIDLKSKYDLSQVTVTTDLTYSNAAHPQARTSGAFDGSIDYWSGAYKTGTSGYYTIDLQQDHTMNAIGVCLLEGQTQSATIEHALNAGGPWTNIKTYTNAIHNTLDYTSVTAFTARYIRVNVTGTSLVGLNEIALFNTADTYEDWVLNIMPYGYTMLNDGFWLSEGVAPLPTGYKSQRALYMDDDDNTAKEISKTGFVASATKTFSFRLRTKAFAAASAIQWRLRSGTTNVFRIAVFSDGSIRYYNGVSYILIGAAGTVPLDTWKLIKVEANASGNAALVYVEGSLIGTATKETASATSMNGFLFGSGGSAPIGDKALFDDVDFYTTGTQQCCGPMARYSGTSTKEQQLAYSSFEDKPEGIFVYPNPSLKIFKLNINTNKNGPLTISVFNSTGVLVRVIKDVKDGPYNKEVNLFGLTPGNYNIKVNVTGFNKSKTVILQ